MKLWIDGDSCPKGALTAALGLARRACVAAEVVADRSLGIVEENGIRLTVVAHGSGRTDAVITEGSRPGDVVVTRDLFLADRLMSDGVRVMNDRGRIWTEKALKRRMEDGAIMRAMREGGMTAKQAPGYSGKDVLAFSISLESLLN